MSPNKVKVSNKGVSDCCAIMPSAPSDVLALSDESDQGGGRSRPSRLPTVEELSDEEPTKFKPDPTSQGSKGLKRKVDSKLAKPVSRHAVRVKILKLTSGVCQCFKKSIAKVKPQSCFRQFLSQIEDLTDLRVKLKSLRKLDADKRVLSSNLAAFEFLPRPV